MLKKSFGLFVLILLLVSQTAYAQNDCSDDTPPPISNPGGDNPDDTFACDTGNPDIIYISSDPKLMILETAEFRGHHT